MQKATTLPSTSREWHLSGASAKLRCLMEQKDRHGGMRGGMPPEAIALCGTHSVRRSCSSTCAATAASSSSDNPAKDSIFSRDKVFFGWLSVEANRKREFKWRFCVLDGAHFSYFCDSQNTSQRLGHHVLTGVERLHCINRGFLLIDDEHRRIWAHAGHETSDFEDWFAAFRSAIEYERKRRDGSIFLRPSRLGGLPRHTDPLTWRNDASSLDVSLTGWMRMRKRVLRLNWLFSSATRLYCVLSGRHLSAFSVNLEGRWVDFYGKVVRVRPCTNGYWLEIAMEDGNRIRIAGKAPEITTRWFERMLLVLQRESLRE